MPGNLAWTLDDRRLAGERGQTVLEAAQQAGVAIPHLCRGSVKAADGRCRLCTAMINGRARAACTEPLAEGMRVESDTSELRALRRTIMEIILSECRDSADAAEIRAEATRLGAETDAFSAAPPCPLRDTGPGGIVIDHARCIMCGRCVRASDAAGAAGLVRLIGRGPGRRVWFDSQAATGNGAFRAAAAACPTGALRVGSTARGDA